MAFSLIRSLVRHTIQKTGDYLTGGTFPLGSIAAGIFDDWCADGDVGPQSAAGQRHVQAELAKILQDCQEYRRQVQVLVAEATDNVDVQRRAMGFLVQVPGKIQTSLQRRDDPTGLTVPGDLALRKAEDLLRFLPDRLPRFQPGDRPVPGNDLVLEELVGVGGFGEVWKAVHKSRPHLPPVALKFCTDESALRSLRKEVELLDRVRLKGRHQGILELIYAHLDTDTPCLEYEFIAGGDLAALIADMHKAGKAQPLTMAKILRLIAIPVGHAHRVKPPIVHRDLKPQNILTTRENGKLQFKVADFGIGAIASEKAIHDWSSETKAGSLLTESAASCTPLYASPQQRRFEPATPRDDVYALGVILYQMLLGDSNKEPPRGGSWKRRLAEKGVPAALIAVVERCIEDDPAERPADARALADELGQIVESESETDRPLEIKPVEIKPIATTPSTISAARPTQPNPIPLTGAEPLALPVAEPVVQTPPPAPETRAPVVQSSTSAIPLAKRIGVGILGGASIYLAGIAIVMTISEVFEVRSNAFVGAIMVAYLVAVGWLALRYVSTFSWRIIGLIVGACLAIFVGAMIVSSVILDNRNSRRYREQYYKDKDKSKAIYTPLPFTKPEK